MSNAVVLMTDEHCPFYSSVYGHPFVSTPNMDRLARMGTVFENAYCPSPLCLPSRSSFMSGRRVHEIRTYSNCNVNLESRPSYGRLLAEEGVHTAYVGKVDVYEDGQRLGFSEMILPGNRRPPGDLNHGRTPLMIRADAAERADGFGVRDDPFRGDLEIAGAAVEWLTRKAPELKRPWTLSVNLLAPHFSHYVTQELWDMYPQGADLPEHGPECESAKHPYARDLIAHFQTDRFREDQIRGLRRGYLGRVTFIDRQLGRIIGALEATGQLKDTCVVYTSDHGEMLGKFGMWWKCSLYEDSVRVPLVAAGPGLERGVRVKTAVDLLDLQAAVFKAVGARRPEDRVGVPLQDVPTDDPQRVVFSEYHAHGTRSGAFMIRQGRWKLIYCMDAPHQLFDLADDPHELENLHEREPEKASQLERELREICSPEGENRRAHAFEKEQLRAAGVLS